MPLHVVRCMSCVVCCMFSCCMLQHGLVSHAAAALLFAASAPTAHRRRAARCECAGIHTQSASGQEDFRRAFSAAPHRRHSEPSSNGCTPSRTVPSVGSARAHRLRKQRGRAPSIHSARSGGVRWFGPRGSHGCAAARGAPLARRGAGQVHEAAPRRAHDSARLIPSACPRLLRDVFPGPPASAVCVRVAQRGSVAEPNTPWRRSL